MIAVAAPILAEIPLGIRVPVMVIEMALGVLVGPHGLGLVGVLNPDEPAALLGQAGLGFLFFVVGMEIDVGRFKGRPLGLAVVSWSFSLALALTIVTILYLTSFFREPVMIAVALTTTSTGMLVPVLRDAGELETNFGHFFMAAATLGEFGPIVMIAMFFTRAHSYPQQAILMLFFVVVAISMGFAAMRIRPLPILQYLHRTLHLSSQLPVRICMLLLTFLMTLAGSFGIDAILGAFSAGMVVGAAAQGKDGRLIREKIDAIGFGYFVPFFFVTSRMQFDLSAITRSLASMLLTPMFLILLLVVRGVPMMLYRNQLPKEERWPFALYLATALPLVVAITDIGVHTGHMREETAASLIAAAALSSLLFPACGDLLLARGRTQVLSLPETVEDLG